MLVLEWRARVKNIAILEIIFISLEILAAAILTSVLLYFYFLEDNRQYNEVVDHLWNASFISVVVLIVIMIVIGMFAAVKLLHSSDQGMDPRKSLRSAKFWNNITTAWELLTMIAFFAFLPISSSIITAIPLIVTIFWRSISQYIVSKFIKELGEVIASQSTKDVSGPLDL